MNLKLFYEWVIPIIAFLACVLLVIVTIPRVIGHLRKKAEEKQGAFDFISPWLRAEPTHRHNFPRSREMGEVFQCPPLHCRYQAEDIETPSPVRMVCVKDGS